MASVSIDLTQRIPKKKTQKTTSNGYPVVTIEDNFNIEAKPNTFYNIKNSSDSEINITFGNDYLIDKADKHIMFTGDAVFDEGYPEESMDIVMFFSLFGGKVYKNSSKEGYTHKLDISAWGMITSFYFSDEIKTGNNVSVLCVPPDNSEGEEPIRFELNNIIILNDDINYLVYINVPEFGITPHYMLEMDNDHPLYTYKYNIVGPINMIMGISEIFTNEPYYNASIVYAAHGSVLGEIQVVSNVESTGSDVTNEVVFNVKTPANIIFNRTIKWHNNTPPDLSQTGTCTLSIVNGVGCYTFVNN